MQKKSEVMLESNSALILKLILEGIIEDNFARSNNWKNPV